MAQLVFSHWCRRTLDGRGHDEDHNNESTSKSALQIQAGVEAIVRNAGCCSLENSHLSDENLGPIGYRVFMDVAVRWRRVAEPGDPVWWIDGLPPDAFRAGYSRFCVLK